MNTRIRNPDKAPPPEWIPRCAKQVKERSEYEQKKDGFQKGGVKKFRMKTIDRKDEIFRNIANALK